METKCGAKAEQTIDSAEPHATLYYSVARYNYNCISVFKGFNTSFCIAFLAFHGKDKILNTVCANVE